MSEFNNRIAAQRDVLLIVNRRNWLEELFGLSGGAIRRWVEVNRLQMDDSLVRLVFATAEKLFFLSNKSQEQISDDYRLLSAEVAELTRKIDQAVRSLG